jgi:membrane protein implicated in regulation of membrane protease activity
MYHHPIVVLDAFVISIVLLLLSILALLLGGYNSEVLVPIIISITVSSILLIFSVIYLRKNLRDKKESAPK